MNKTLLALGAIVLVAGVFGYMYSQEQQGLLQQGEDIVSGEQRDWSLIKSLSGAGIVAGIILLVAGVFTHDREIDESYR